MSPDDIDHPSAHVPSSELGDRREWTFTFYRWALRGATVLLGLFFVNTFWAQVPRPPLDRMDAFLILKLTMVLYMYCWYFGCSRDLSVQETVLVNVPSPGRRETALVIVVVVIFGAMFYFDNPLLFAGSFVTLLIVNILGWLYMRRLIRPYADIAERERRAEQDSVGVLRTYLFKEYSFGAWQGWRFGAGLVMLSALGVVAAGRMPTVPTMPQLTPELTFSLTTLATVLVLESWIWFKRLELWLLWRGLSWLRRNGFHMMPPPE